MTRERSLWAWGYADKQPDEEGRRAALESVKALLGFDNLELLKLPDSTSLQIPAPRLGVPDELVAFSSADPMERARHTYGKAYPDLVRAFRGDFASAPDLVIAPRDDGEVEAALRWCGRERVAAVPYGGGTSVVAGVECKERAGFAGVACIDLRELSRVLEVDEVSRAARVQAGILGPELDRQLQPLGLTLRHYPQSFEFSTLGGWIATRAGGHFATLYTHIDDLVESIKLVTPQGVLQTQRFPASGAGPQPERLILGSEGSLGIITEAWVRLQRRPIFRSSASVLFDDFLAAAGAARAIAQAQLYPANCRLLDAREAMLNGVPAEGASALLLGFESADAPRAAWLERALQLCEPFGGRCPAGPRHREQGARGGADATAEGWRQAFIDAPYLQSTLVSLGAIADTFETACTWDRFEALHAGVTKAMTEALQAVCGGGSLTCRLTHVYPDGPAPYFTFIAPAGPRGSGDVLEKWWALKRAAGDALLAHGATITHHHAVGRTHRPWYDRERPPLFGEALRAAKRALDPAGVMNPGVLVDP